MYLFDSQIVNGEHNWDNVGHWGHETLKGDFDAPDIFSLEDYIYDH